MADIARNNPVAIAKQDVKNRIKELQQKILTLDTDFCQIYKELTNSFSTQKHQSHTQNTKYIKILERIDIIKKTRDTLMLTSTQKEIQHLLNLVKNLNELHNEIKNKQDELNKILNPQTT
ncbi:hypothetical protein ACFX5K_06185 [Rickettsiales bacterium LUAb2]